MICMKFQLNPKLLLLFHLFGVMLAIGVIVFLTYVDNIVNVSLYEYDLKFDPEWAIPYWTFLRLALGLLGCVVSLNIFSMIFVFLSSRTAALPKISTYRDIRVKSHVGIERRAEEKEAHSENYVEVAAVLPMVCNKCGKSFSQPLCMFDFKEGKPRLVSVCPYCNAVLAVSGNSKIR